MTSTKLMQNKKYMYVYNGTESEHRETDVAGS